MTVQDFLQLHESSIGPTGARWDDCIALNVLNKARSALYGIDAWSGIVDTICVNACQFIYLPWFADITKGAYRCDGIIPIATGEYWTYANGAYKGLGTRITDLNKISPVPVTNDFSSRIAIKSEDFNDEGVSVKVTYQSHGGSIITEDLSVGFQGYSVTETKVKRFLSIRKPATHGYIRFYSVNSDGVVGDPIFPAAPMETHLQYKAYCIESSCCSSCKQIIIDVKRKFIPFSDMHYNLAIEFPDHALALAMQAVSELDKRTPDGNSSYQSLMGSAISYLRKNQIKEKDTYGDAGDSDDYPEID